MRLLKLDLTARARLVVHHDVAEGRGRTTLGVEVDDGADAWRTTKSIAVGNAALFLLHDALGRAIAMASKEPR